MAGRATRGIGPRRWPPPDPGRPLPLLRQQAEAVAIIQGFQTCHAYLCFCLHGIANVRLLWSGYLAVPYEMPLVSYLLMPKTCVEMQALLWYRVYCFPTNSVIAWIMFMLFGKANSAKRLIFVQHWCVFCSAVTCVLTVHSQSSTCSLKNLVTVDIKLVPSRHKQHTVYYC